jgi:hypothetical protein
MDPNGIVVERVATSPKRTRSPLAVIVPLEHGEYAVTSCVVAASLDNGITATRAAMDR